MDTTVLMICSFISLVGLHLCYQNTPNGKWEADLIEKRWTNNLYLRLFYAICCIVGCFFVLGTVGYLTFAVKWWYVLVYFGGFILAKFIAFLLRRILFPFYKMSNDFYAYVVVQRVVGMFLIILGIALAFIL